MALCRSLLVVFLLSACSVPRYQEFEAGPLTRGELWRGAVRVAADHGYPSGSGTDQGLMIYESRWNDNIVMQDRHPARRRLHMEFQPFSDDERMWVVRFYVQRQRVDDPALLFARTEGDYEDDGQDAGEETTIGNALRGKFGVPIQQTGVRDPGIR